MFGTCLLMSLAALVESGSAEARVEAELGYTKAQTYSAALRYLRTELGFEVLEKDPDAAYLIFRYEPKGQSRPSNGTLEIIETRDKVKLFVQLPELPEYHERVLRDGLVKKLRDEYGAPPSARAKEDRPPGDGGRG